MIVVQQTSMQNTFRTTPTVPGALEASGIWKMALCMCGSKGSFVGSNFFTPNFLSTCKQQLSTKPTRLNTGTFSKSTLNRAMLQTYKCFSKSHFTSL